MSKIVYIDVETGGIDPKINPVLQLSGVVEIDDKIKERFNWFIRCPSDKKVEESALQVCNLTMEQVTSLELPTYNQVYWYFVKMLDRYVNKFDKTDKFFFCGYNALFDDSMMRQFFIDNAVGDKAKQWGNYYGSYFHFPVIDVAVQAGIALMDKRIELPNFKLKTVYSEIYGEEETNRIDWHDAKADIEATIKLFKYFKNKGSLI